MDEKTKEQVRQALQEGKMVIIKRKGGLQIKGDKVVVIEIER